MVFAGSVVSVLVLAGLLLLRIGRRGGPSHPLAYVAGVLFALALGTAVFTLLMYFRA